MNMQTAAGQGPQCRLHLNPDLNRDLIPAGSPPLLQVTESTHTKEQTMQPIEFIGVRGGHGTTTVALAAAVTLATGGPTRVSTHDRRAMCAIVGIAHDGLPVPITEHLDLVPGEHDGDVIDAGTLERYLNEVPFDDVLAQRRQHASTALRIGVLRGPDYLGLRKLCEHAEAHLDGLVVVSEAGRALDARDVEHVSGRPVVAVVDHTPTLARTVDAGLFVQPVGRLREFVQLRAWITRIAVEEAPCAVVS